MIAHSAEWEKFIHDYEPGADYIPGSYASYGLNTDTGSGEKANKRATGGRREPDPAQD